MEDSLLTSNYFEWIPFDIVTIILSSITSISTLGKAASTCKSFYKTISANDLFWKRPCLDWYVDQLGDKDLFTSDYLEKKNLPPAKLLEWAIEKAHSYDSSFYNWKFVAKCIQNNLYQLQTGSFSLGSM